MKSKCRWLQGTATARSWILSRHIEQVSGLSGCWPVASGAGGGDSTSRARDCLCSADIRKRSGRRLVQWSAVRYSG